MTDTPISRRTFVTTAAGVTGATALAGVAGAQEGGNGTNSTGDGDGEHSGEEFSGLPLNVQLMFGAIVVAALSPLVFAALLLEFGTRGRAPDDTTE